MGGTLTATPFPSSDQTFKYDIKLDTFEKRANMLRPRQAFGLAYLRDEIFVICGANSHQTTPWCEKYCITSDTWSMMPDMLEGLVGCSVQILKSRYLYILGGQRAPFNTNTHMEKFYRLDLSKKS